MSNEKTYKHRKLLSVGGTFDDLGGRKSGYFERLVEGLDYLDRDFGEWSDTILVNGGSCEHLEQALKANKPDFILWMADVPNDKPKLLSMVKELHPKSILVGSKRNDDGKYGFMDLVARALHAKMNLFVEFVKRSDGLVEASLYDPLGNVFGTRLSGPEMLAYALYMRMTFLARMTRLGSVQDGPSLEVPDKPELFNLVQGYAEKFHELIHGVNTTRMLGNVSFRCENGFASFRDRKVFYVSRRNLDKRMIGKEGFVAVDLADETQVRYHGDAKPSVDAPIHAALYRVFPVVNYMLHSHVYIEGAPFTNSVVPCGALEEVDAVMEVVSTASRFQHRINLRGHGSLVMAWTLEDLIDIPYVARKCPEQHEQRT